MDVFQIVGTMMELDILRILLPFFIYILSRNHRLALRFAHFISNYSAFSNIDQLLLNMYLLIKHSTVNKSIFDQF